MRMNVRAVLLTPESRILMMKLQEPVTRNEFWITPGGTVEPGEDFKTALLRELKEEIGRDDFEIGPLIWIRKSTYTWNKRTVTHQEHYYYIETEEFTPRMVDALESEEFKAFREFRWWNANEIQDSDGQFGPKGIGNFLAGLIEKGIPHQPIDLATWMQ